MSNQTISITSKGGQSENINLNTQSSTSILIGRGKQCKYSFPDESSVSSEHVQLVTDGSGAIYIIDLNSLNGTFHNGKRLSSGQPYPIRSGDTIFLTSSGAVKISITGGGKVQSGSYKSISSLLAVKETVTIGRQEDCDYVINQPSVSRKHATISRHSSSGIYVIKDLGSLNGTYVNGEKIIGSKKVSENDVIFIGRYQLALKGVEIDLSKEVAIRAINVTKVFSTGKTGLHKCTFDISVNSLTAIMGPSGCGKSTLLKALNGDAPASGGEVYISGLSLRENFNYLKSQIGYVPQDDIIHRELTVDECLWYAAKLKLIGAPEDAIRQKIDQVMKDLNISQIRNNLVGKVSGGQRKRIAIATEILTDPLILFLDEPTSPLDPQTIEEFLKILKLLANRGTAVIMVTHKPEDLDYMDEVIFMAEGGHMIFQGPTNNYLNYFSKQNTVEVYAQLVTPHSSKWIERHRSTQNNQSSKPLSSGGGFKNQRTNYFNQYYWLTRRYLNIKLNDKVNSLILIGQAPIIAFLITLIFDKVSAAVPFVVSLSAIWFGTNNAAREIVNESAIYKRERMFNQGIWPYLFSKITVLSIFATIQTLIFVAIILIGFSGGEPEWNDAVGTVIRLSITSLTATAFGLFLSSNLNNTEKVMAVVPITLIPQMLLAGVIAKITDPIVEFISYFTLSRWSNELLTINQEKLSVEYISFDSSRPDLGQNNSNMLENSGKFLKEQFHPSYTDYFGDWASTQKLDVLILGIMGLVLLFLTYWFMKQKDPI